VVFCSTNRRAGGRREDLGGFQVDERCDGSVALLMSKYAHVRNARGGGEWMSRAARRREALETCLIESDEASTEDESSMAEEEGATQARG
jgi:hypothetical protein